MCIYSHSGWTNDAMECGIPVRGYIYIRIIYWNVWLIIGFIEYVGSRSWWAVHMAEQGNLISLLVFPLQTTASGLPVPWFVSVLVPWMEGGYSMEWFRPGYDRACYGLLCICTSEGYRSVAPLGASTNVNRTIRITRLQVGIFGRCFMKHTRYQVSYTIIGITITGVHSNQDQIWLVRMGEYIGFYVDRRSWLLWSPVNRWFFGSTGRCYDDG